MRQRGERILSTQKLFCSEGNTLTGETSSPDRFEALRRLNNAIPKDSAAFFFAGRQFTHCRQKTHCSAVQALCLRPTSLAARLNSWSERGGLRPCCSPRRQPLLERTRRPASSLQAACQLAPAVAPAIPVPAPQFLRVSRGRAKHEPTDATTHEDVSPHHVRRRFRVQSLRTPNRR